MAQALYISKEKWYKVQMITARADKVLQGMRISENFYSVVGDRGKIHLFLLQLLFNLLQLILFYIEIYLLLCHLHPSVLTCCISSWHSLSLSISMMS